MSDTYFVKNFADLLRVPVDRRASCASELLLGLAKLEESFTAQEALRRGAAGFDWTDDGCAQLTVCAPASQVKTVPDRGDSTSGTPAHDEAQGGRASWSDSAC